MTVSVMVGLQTKFQGDFMAGASIKGIKNTLSTLSFSVLNDTGWYIAVPGARECVLADVTQTQLYCHSMEKLPSGLGASPCDHIFPLE